MNRIGKGSLQKKKKYFLSRRFFVCLKLNQYDTELADGVGYNHGEPYREKCRPPGQQPFVQAVFYFCRRITQPQK